MAKLASTNVFGDLTVSRDIKVNGDTNVEGTLSATTKNFLIPHPNKSGMMLRHGSLEGPENAVYVRGTITQDKIINLPDFWEGLIDKETITVTITPIGKTQDLFISEIKDNKIFIESEETLLEDIKFFYVAFAERKDIPKMMVEF